MCAAHGGAERVRALPGVVVLVAAIALAAAGLIGTGHWGGTPAGRAAQTGERGGVSARAMAGATESVGQAGSGDVAGDTASSGDVGEGLAMTDEWDEAGELADVARARLESYRACGGVLVRAGYVDLLGRTWGCVVALDGGVEVCWVVQAADQAQSHVLIQRMEGVRWEEAYAAQT